MTVPDLVDIAPLLSALILGFLLGLAWFRGLYSQLFGATVRLDFALACSFVSSLSGGEDQVITGECLLIKALPSVLYERYGNITNSIYVRKCYKDLYELAVIDMLNPKYERNVTLFTGVPGIGKSLFLVYFIYRFLSDKRFPDKRFALEFRPGIYHMFEPIGYSGNTFKKTTLDAKCVHPKDFLLLCDILEPAEPHSIAKWTFIFSSPDRRRHKYMMKTPCACMFTMPTWSESELRFLAPDNGGWLDAFCTFGGVPRYVFLGPYWGNSDALLIQALGNTWFELAVPFLAKAHGGTDDEHNYMLIHMNPREATEGDYDYYYSGPVYYSFASQKIFDRFSKINTQGLIAEAVNLFNEGSAIRKLLGDGTAGKYFEMVCLSLCPITGRCLKANQLLGSIKSTSTEDFHVPATKGLLSIDWKKTNKLETDKLYVSRFGNMDSGNAFYLVPIAPPRGIQADGRSASNALAARRGREQAYMLVVLQVTVAVSHPIKANGLIDILGAFPESLRSKISKKALVFIKNACGTFYQEQAILNRPDNNIPVEIRDFEQYVCSYRLSETPPPPGNIYM